MDILDLSGWTLWAVVGAFAAAAAVIALAGSVLTRAADVLADLTGIGEALVGAVLLGGVTSLAGVVTSLAAAGHGHPTLAVSNAIGGIAVQTFFLAIADLAYRKANLEHAAASLPNVMNSALLLGLLVLVLLVVVAPEGRSGGSTRARCSCSSPTAAASSPPGAPRRTPCGGPGAPRRRSRTSRPRSPTSTA